MDKKYYLYLFGFSILLFLVGFLYGIKNGTQNYESDIDLSGGKYVRMVYIGSSKCVYSNNEHTHKMVSDIKERLGKIFKKSSSKFISTGISMDRSSKQGLIFLEKSGEYDEILVGSGNFNLGMIHYTAGASSTPKIMFYIEKYNTELIGINMSNLINSQKPLKMYNGQFEIEDLHKFIKTSSRKNIYEFFGLKNKMDQNL